MTTFTLTIEHDGATSEYDPEQEIVRLLREAANFVKKVGLPAHPVTMRDINGNRVGEFGMK